MRIERALVNLFSLDPTSFRRHEVFNEASAWAEKPLVEQWAIVPPVIGGKEPNQPRISLHNKLYAVGLFRTRPDLASAIANRVKSDYTSIQESVQTFLDWFQRLLMIVQEDSSSKSLNERILDAARNLIVVKQEPFRAANNDDPLLDNISCQGGYLQFCTDQLLRYPTLLVSSLVESLQKSGLDNEHPFAIAVNSFLNTEVGTKKISELLGISDD